MDRCALLLCLCCAGCTRNGPPPNPAKLLSGIEALRGLHKPDAALRAVDSALRRNSWDDDTSAKLYVLKSHILRERDNLEQARAFLASVAALRAPIAEYLVKREQAAVDSDLGHFEEADRYLAQAISLARSAGKARQVAGTEVTRSRILLKLDRPDEAQASLDSARRYSEASGDHSLDPYILQYSVRILLQGNRFEEALAPLEASYRKFSEAKQPQLAAKVAIDLAWAYYRLGQLDKARELYERAGPDAAPGDRHLFVGHLGNIFHDRDDLARAAANYKSAMELARNQDKDSYSTWLSNLATTLTDESKWSEAAKYNSEALNIAKDIPGSIGLAHAMVNAGRIAAGRHDYELAERELREVASMPHANPAAVLDAYAALAQVYEETNRPEEAKHQFDLALKLVDTARTNLRDDEDKLSYLASLMKLHQQYVAFLMAGGEIAGAFEVSELSRARVLRDRLNSKKPAARSHTLPEYQKAARESGSTYLVYWVAPARSFLWLIDGARFLSFPLPGEKQLRALVERHQRTLERDGTGGANSLKAAAELFELAVRPALKALPAARRFIIVPDGPLYGINFETLRDNSRYWIEDATIAIAPSLELMLERRPTPPQALTALLVGDAIEWTPEFPKLLNASMEMASIARHLPPGSHTELAGAQATPAIFMKSAPEKFAYIHFAAHATANRNAPLDSAIILSSGRLSVKDVQATPVRARLVTISACSSAGARTYSGEGLVGFAWAFLQSGARGVVAGLWDVSEYSSPVLMEHLYAGLAAGREPADALRSAKLKLLKPGGKYSDPYYWGAFQLYVGGR